MSTRSARTKKVQVQTEEETMLSAWFGQGFAEAAARLAKAEDLLHKCNAQSAEALELATSALKKRTDGNSTKLNTHMNEMAEKMDLLKARVQEVEDDHAETRSKLESLKDWIEDQLDHMRHERRHRGTEKRTPPSNTPTAEDGDELARRVMAHKQERAAKMRGSRMLEELSEVSGTSAPVTTPTMSTTGTMGRRRSRCRAAAACAASAVRARS